MKLGKKLIIGTANFAKNYGVAQTKVTRVDFEKIIKKCKKFDIDKFDIGESYNVSKKYIKKIKKKKIILKFDFSKYFLYKTNPQKFKKKILNFLIKNNLKKVDTILLHNQNDLLNVNGKSIYIALSMLKKEKIISNLGVSFYDTLILKKVLNKYKIDTAQIPINLFNRDFIKPSLVKLYKKFNLKIYARSIFLQGLLLNFNNNDIYIKKFNKFKKIFDYLKILQTKNKISALEHALSFVCQIKFITGMLIGIDNERHLQEIVQTKIRKIPKFSKSIPADLKDPRKWPFIVNK
jgi:aryl-alcohol dehydrogenase-like predicted oxidoreductase